MSNYNSYMKYDSLSKIGKIREKANKFIVARLEEEGITGIVPSHGDIMAVLFKYEKCTMKEIGEKINRTKATITVLVDKLISLNLIKKEKSPNDNRVTFVSLTEKGKQFKPIFEAISKEINNILYNNLSKEESETLEILLEKVLNNFT